MHRFGLATALLLPCLGGCGAAVYHPRPSPRIQVVGEGSSVALEKDGRKYAVGIFGGELGEAVKGNARAEQEARSYQTKGVAGFVLALASSLTTAGGAAMFVSNELSQEPSVGLRAGGLGMVLGGVALSIVGSMLSAGAHPHLWNAINLYNDGLPQAPAWYGPRQAPTYAPPAPAPTAPLPMPTAPMMPPVPAPAPPAPQPPG